jgi:hypothetical protein
VCRRHSSIVEVGSDLAEGPSGLVLGADVVDEVWREDTRTSALRALRLRSSQPSLVGDHSLEFVDWD